MSHYTLQSGKDTSTVTYKCDGCGIRESTIPYYTETQSGWTVTVCSSECQTRADKRFNRIVLHGQANRVIREIIEVGAINPKTGVKSYTFDELYNHIYALEQGFSHGKN